MEKRGQSCLVTFEGRDRLVEEWLDGKMDR